MLHPIIRNEDLSERVPYTAPETHTHIAKYDLRFIPSPIDMDASHWHDDIELILVVKGHMSYGVNGTTYRMQSGEGIFINARQIHNGYYAGASDCTYVCVLMHPMMLCANSYIEQTFIEPVINNTAFSCRHLKPENTGDRAILNSIAQIYDAEQNADPIRPLIRQSLFYQLWAQLFEINPIADKHTHAQNARLTALKSMMSYIQKHYTQKLTLEDIAAVGNVCKSGCSKLFQSYLHQSPIRFLTECRLKKAAELLHGTDLNITEIAYACGFSGASYFTETFRNYLFCTPSEYRQKAEEETEKSH